MPATQLDILAEELGAVAGRIERESALRIDAAIADLRRLDAERELRLVNLESAVADRLRSVKDGAPGKDGANLTVDDVAPLIDAAVAKAIAAIPEPKDGEAGRDGVGITVDDVTPLIDAAVAKAIAAIPEPKDGKDGFSLKDFDTEMMPDGKTVRLKWVSGDVEEVHDLEFKVRDGCDGRSVTVDEVRPIIEEMIASFPKPKDGENGKDGKMPIAKAWADQVQYAGAVLTHLGSTYQALRDTGREPPHDDWVCLAAAGENGKDGRSPKVRDTFSPDVDDYRDLNIVALGGAAFIARRDNPGPCPGDGWQLISSQGKRGNVGDRGGAGPRGPAGPAIERMSIDGDGLLTLANVDGSTVDCDLYPLLEKLQR